MGDTTVPVQGNSGNIAVPASGEIASYSATEYQVFQTVGYPNFPQENKLLFQGSGFYTSSAFTSAATLFINAGAQPVIYNVGSAPVVGDVKSVPTQGAPATLDATGTLTGAKILAGIVTSSTAAAVTATLDTGTVMDSTISMSAGDWFDWTAINTGGSNAFTVTAATGHTIVGAGAVAASTSGRFRTRKTAAATFVTYRLS